MTFQVDGVLGIKSAEGTIVPILDFQTQKWNQAVFTTVADGQQRAQFEFYYRDKRSAQWVYFDNLPLERIPLAPAGEPDLSVEANVDARGNLSVELYDPARQKNFTFVLKVEALIRTVQETKGTNLSDGQTIGPPQVQSSAAKRKRKGRWILGFILGAIVIVIISLFAWRRFSMPLRVGAMAARQSSVFVTAQRTESPVNPGKTAAHEAKPEKTAVAAKAPDGETVAPAAVPSISTPLKTQTRVGEYFMVVSVLDGKSPDDASWYQIRWGDTLWQITKRFYGEYGLFRELAESNRIPDPDYIIAGQRLSLPPSLLGKKRSSLTGGPAGRSLHR